MFPLGCCLFFFASAAVFLPQTAGSQLRVVGNLAVVANPIGHAGTPEKPLQVNVGKLWCGVQNLGEAVGVSYGHFVRVSDGKEFEGRIDDKKVWLDVGKAPSTVAGKYRCEVRTDDGDVLGGNSFIYLAPVLHLPAGSADVTEFPAARPPKVVGAKVSASPGDLVVLKCPIFGYPQPFVHWKKDGEPVDPSKVEFQGDDLHIPSISTDDAGVYTCTGDNSFPLFVDGPAMPHQLNYEQRVLVV